MQKQFLLDTRPESYGPFFTDDFGHVAIAASNDVEALRNIVFDLVTDWRTASYSGALPSLLPSLLKSFHDGYANEEEPNTGTLRFADAIVGLMAQKMSEVSADSTMQRRLRENIVRIGAELKAISGTLRIEMNIEEVWSQFFSLIPFQLGVVGTLRLVLVSIYSAYENFIVRVLSLALGDAELRVTNKKRFEEAFRGTFGDLYERGWTDPQIHAYRLVRNALMHAGGRVTSQLRQVSIPVVTDNEILHVYPEHVKELYNLLKVPVLEVIRSSSFREGS